MAQEIKTNKVNTEIDKEFLGKLNREEREMLLEYITAIPFVQNLISKDRLTTKDLDRWEDPNNDEDEEPRTLDPNGRIRVDITNPHILEDMNYFRQAAIHFEEHGVYTFIRQSRNPFSDWRLYWDEEIRRCWEGMVRPSDGEWIPGYFYFYLNYSPIMKSKRRKGSKRADRVQGLPDFYDGDYLFFHYLERARDNGQHTITLKKRGAGYSLKGGSKLGRNFILGESAEANKNVNSFAIANEKEYLTKDGILNKFVDVIDFCAEHTPFPRIRELKNSWVSMHWMMGYKEKGTDIEKGTHNQVLGVTLNGDHEKARGKRGVLIEWEEFGKFPNAIKAWNIGLPSVQEEGGYVFGLMNAYGTGGCLTAGNQVFTSDGRMINIENIQMSDGIIGFEKGVGVSKEPITYWQAPTKKECVKIVTNTMREIECSLDHPILSRVGRGRINNIHEFLEAGSLLVGSKVMVADSIDLFGTKRMWMPRMVGLMIGDGTYGYNQTARIANCDIEVTDYIESNFDCKTLIERETKEGKIYKEIRIKDIRPELRKLGIIDQTKLNKTLPKNIGEYSKEDLYELIGGFFDADGYVNIRKNKSRGTDIAEISLASASKSLLMEVLFLLQKFGIHGRIRERKPRSNKTGIKDVNSWFEYTIADSRSLIKFTENIKLLPKVKQERLNEINKVFSNIKKHGREDLMREETIVSIEKTGLKNVYNLTAGRTNTYLGNGIITHNTEGAAFAGLRELFYNPGGYHVYPLPNVFDKNSKQGNLCGFFHASYLNMKGNMDENGNSDVVASLSSLIKNRIHIKYNSAESSTITQTIAENPVTPQEAIMKSFGGTFDTIEIRDYLEECRVNEAKFTSANLVGDLIINSTGTIEFKTNFDKNPIRKYNCDKTNLAGAIEIFSSPEIDLSTGRPFNYRYIAGIDPVDSDYVKNGSLASIFVFDLWNDEIVAEYTGRPDLAEDFYEICRRLLIFYNAIGNYENNIKGLFGYFNGKNSLYLLCDAPRYLKDVEDIRQAPMGNQSKGTRTTSFIIEDGKRLQKSWHRSLHKKVNAKGEEIETPQLRRIKSLGYLEEIYEYHIDGNFDRVSAMDMVMILRQERLRLTESREKEEIDKSYVEQDQFVLDNYDEGFSTEDSFDDFEGNYRVKS